MLNLSESAYAKSIVSIQKPKQCTYVLCSTVSYEYLNTSSRIVSIVKFKQMFNVTHMIQYYKVRMYTILVFVSIQDFQHKHFPKGSALFGHAFNAGILFQYQCSTQTKKFHTTKTTIRVYYLSLMDISNTSNILIVLKKLYQC